MKSCPFCDSVDIRTRITPMVNVEKGSHYAAYALCFNCEARGPMCYLTRGVAGEMHAAAREAWDKREAAP